MLLGIERGQHPAAYRSRAESRRLPSEASSCDAWHSSINQDLLCYGWCWAQIRSKHIMVRNIF